MKIAQFAVAVCSCLLLTAPSTADTVLLNDGREYKGTVVVKGKTYTVITGGKMFQFRKSQVKSHVSGDEAAPAPTDADAAAVADAAAAASEPEATGDAATANPVVRIVTSKGNMQVELFEDKVPNTVANMISLAESGFYQGMRFHRVIPGFMAQAGCPNSKPGATGMPGTGGPGYRFEDEFHPDLKHNGPGILSMANSGPNTNGSQFFICFTATPHLDRRHSVFGRVIDGTEVLTKLEAIGSRSGKTSEDVEFNIKVVSKRPHPYVVQKL